MEQKDSTLYTVAYNWFYHGYVVRLSNDRTGVEYCTRVFEGNEGAVRVRKAAEKFAFDFARANDLLPLTSRDCIVLGRDSDENGYLYVRGGLRRV